MNFLAVLLALAVVPPLAAANDPPASALHWSRLPDIPDTLGLGGPFVGTSDGALIVGPLFVMEKMKAGFNPASDDWRYTMVMPDGSIFGVTKGKGSGKVEFCIGCHKAVAPEVDSMMFLPAEYRAPR